MLRNHLILLRIVLLLLAFHLPALAAAQTYDVPWAVLNEGGETEEATSASYRIRDSIGQSVVGGSASASYTAGTGFGYVYGLVVSSSIAVINTNDSGSGSLRQAILDANASPGTEIIRFDIPGTGPHTIQPASALPTITDPAIIDGYTQPGASPATEVSAATLLIELDGTNAGNGVSGLNISAGNTTVRGLAINRFDGVGIHLHSNGGNTIEGNHIGTDVGGTSGLPNGQGIIVHAPNNTIGGSSERARNIISGNTFKGVWIDGIQATGNRVIGNFIGTDVSGEHGLGNGEYGVGIDGAADNAVAGNTISDNGWSGVGVTQNTGINNRILSNAIHSNGGLGIDLASDHITYNDFGDGDTGANHLQNSPVLAMVINDDSHTRIEGTLNSAPNTAFRIELFSNTAGDPSHYGEGEVFLGSTDVTTDGDGNARFVVTFPTGGLPDRSFTATATDPDNNTSEFSRSIREITLPPGFYAEGFYVGIPWPDGIAVRDDGSLLVVNEGDPRGVFVARRGEMFDLGDAFSTGGDPAFDSPDDILLHPDGTVFVTDGNALQTLFRIPAEGGAPSVFVTPATIPFANNFNPFGITLAPPGFVGPNVRPGDLIVADNAYSGPERAVWAVHPVAPDSIRPIAQGDVFHDGPVQVAFGPDGRMFVQENYWAPGTGRIVTLDSSGTVTPFLSDIPGVRQSMCIHPVTGEVYCGLGGLGEIWRIPPEGGTSEVFASDLVFFQDMAFSPDGLVLFVSVLGNVIEITGPFFEGAEETPEGSDVVVIPQDPQTGTRPVTLTFEEIREAGYTSLVISSDGPPPPPGFDADDPLYHDLTTTAGFEPPVEVCIDYSGAPFESERGLRLFHFEEDRWRDVTTSLDPRNDLICGMVTSLSPFAIFERRPQATKQAAHDALTALLPTGDKKADRGIERAMQHIQKSLNEKLWEDDRTLTKKGKKVFSEEKQAVRELMQIVGLARGNEDDDSDSDDDDSSDGGRGGRQEEVDEEVRDAILSVIGDLVSADEVLAGLAIERAIAEGGRAREIASAEKEMVRAEREIGREHYDKAIEHYKKAWDHAQKAMRRGSKDDDRRDKPTVMRPDRFVLSQNHPNPFNPETEIRYALPERSYVRLSIYNLLGQEIERLVDREQSAGYHTALWDASGMSGGVYLCRMISGEFRAVRKLMLIR